jgi:transposase
LVKRCQNKLCGEFLKKKWRWKRFRRVCPKKPDPAEFEKKCKTLNTLILLFLSGHIDLRYGDETAFTLQPNIPYGWIKEGEQKGIPSRKGGNLNVFGLMNLQGELTTYQTTQSVNSQTVIDWLDDFVSTIKKVTVVILDNAPWHTSQSVGNKITEWENKGMFIFRLPTYSPHLNLIETLWRKMKLEWIKPQAYENKQTLHDAINNILTNYNNDEFNIDFTLNLSC